MPGGYREFNFRLAEARVKIEHAFGILKSRWGSLKGISINIRSAHDHVRILVWVMSWIFLHYFLNNLESDEDWVIDNSIRDMIAEMEEDVVIGIEAERRVGAEWRDQMREYFFH